MAVATSLAVGKLYIQGVSDVVNQYARQAAAGSFRFPGKA